ncbi:MAG TPA: glycyl-radical enzyme activating protein [Candidatus Acidoferrales bacterium]|nr:glycyl-radical enzyme activating protein [Candidatus Acidoferrales bacterium]
MLENPPRATILNIIRFAVHDGPGIRTAVFFKGCPLSCWWCHNPESQGFAPEVLYTPDLCRMCGACAAACPHGAIVPREGRMETTAACARCGTCREFCPAEARTIAGREMTASEILAQIERDIVFFDESGGGVTFTGGEPLAQPVALEALLRACREHRIHSAIETCGASGRDSLLRLCGLADLVLFDLKLAGEERHRFYTGATNRNILENLSALAAAHPHVIVRVPVVPGVNDGAEETAGMCALLRKMTVRSVDLLPYHRTGAHKYPRLCREYRLPDTLPPDAAEMARLAASMQAAGIPARVAG